MDVTTLLADPTAITLEAFVSHDTSITLIVRSAQPVAACPLCQQPSDSLHSNYVRGVADLLWHGVAVRLQLHTRKFRCRNELCQRKVFCQRLPNVVAAGARTTARLNQVLTQLAFVTGGEPGARTARRLGVSVSGDTLLRRMRQHSSQPQTSVRVLGVDDFAFRRGARYGTILVDLEKRQPIDVLPERKAESLQTWLAVHPEIHIISRDRAGCYATGARLGAPAATQIADRFHLLKNLLDGFEKFLHRQAPAISAVSHTVFRSPPAAKASSSSNERVATPPTAAQHLVTEQKQAKLKKREQLFNTIKELHASGVPTLAIARRLKMSRNTVKQFIASRTLPTRRQNKARFSPIHRFLPYLEQRWADGQRSSRALWKEIKEQGYPGAEVTLRHWLQKWRAATTAQITAHARTKSLLGRAPSVRQVKWLLFNPEQRKEDWEQQFATELCRHSAEVESARTLVTEFHQMLSIRQPRDLQQWLDKARASKISELVWFANGVEQDRRAVEAAFEHDWSQGQVEGQVNRLKLIKRQMYGRGNFDTST